MEGILDFLLADPPRPLVSRLLIGKAEDVQQSSMLKHVAKPLDESRAFLVSEGVEQTAVDHRVELPPEFLQFESVPDDESGFNTSLSSFRLGPFDSNRHEVETPRFVAAGRQIQEIFAGAATYVENTATNPASFSQFDDGRLRSSRVPRSLTLIHLLE